MTSYRLTIFVNDQDRLSTKLRAAHRNHSPVPLLLWSQQQYDALTFPYPGYDPERERHMEQQYHKAIRDKSLYRAAQRERKRGALCK
jgi:hypothetical protein